MVNRSLQNLKVLFRKDKRLYKLSLVLYSPIRFRGYIKWRNQAKKLAQSTLLELRSFDPNTRKIVYFGIPTHENLGDAAQYYCIKKWIKSYYPNIDCIEITSKATYSKKVRKKLEKIIGIEDILIFESGATFCNRHEDHSIHRYVLDTFSDNRILFMPQTVDLYDNGELAITASKFNKCPRALFLARDVVSFSEVKKQFHTNRVMLFPDIVTTMIGNFSTENIKRNGILLCKRIDGENRYTDNSIRPYIERLELRYGKIDVTDTNFTNSYDDTMNNLENEINGKLKSFSKYKVIITDRYHGMIFSLISNTPVVVLGTTGHKVVEGAKWFKDIYPQSIFFCETLDEVENAVDNIFDRDIKCHNQSYFKENYFNKLNETFLKL